LRIRTPSNYCSGFLSSRDGSLTHGNFNIVLKLYTTSSPDPPWTAIETHHRNAMLLFG